MAAPFSEPALVVGRVETRLPRPAFRIEKANQSKLAARSAASACAIEGAEGWS